MEALKGGSAFRIHGNRLEILDGRQNTTLKFIRQPPFPGHQPDLDNTEWLMKGDRDPAILTFIDDEVAVGVGACSVSKYEFSTSNRLLRFTSGVASSLQRPCPQRELGDSYWGDRALSFWAAEHYSVIGQAGSERLMVGTSLGATFEFRTLQALRTDVEQEEWTLLNIVNFSPDRPSIISAMRVVAVEGSAVTMTFQETHVAGSAGCNTYEATLRVTDEEVVIGSPTKSDLLCDDLKGFHTVMKQEAATFPFCPKCPYGSYGDVFMSGGHLPAVRSPGP